MWYDQGMATLFLLLSSLLHPAPVGNLPPPSCGDTDDCDGDGWTPNDGDCDDGEDGNYPGGLEVCDGIDNDCDNIVDEGQRIPFYLPVKGGDACRVVPQWSGLPGETVYRCQQPNGYVPACPRI